MRIPRESLATMALVAGCIVSCSSTDPLGHSSPVDRTKDGGGDADAATSTGGAAPTEGGARDAADGHFNLPPTPTSCPKDNRTPPYNDPVPPSSSDAAVFGCYETRILAPVDWVSGAPLPDCPNTSGACTYAPSGIPCGKCDYPGLACDVTAWAPCNCGQRRYLDIYWDGWTCKCTNGEWDCRVTAAAGSSCFDECRVDSGARGLDASADAK